ncbi:MAG: tRNA pseudouridine(38-40) synthase TruA [Sphingomonadales bacterium]
MARYFLEVSYRGTNYSGFQSQENANTIQQEVEQAFRTLQRASVQLTSSSRTDAGVHALQNFFHFDFDAELHSQFIYKINAILPGDIVVKSLRAVDDDAHCRFDAISRTYEYFIYRGKDPFLQDRAWYFPYTINVEALQQAAQTLREYKDFTSFSKRNTQVKTFDCAIMECGWSQQQNCLVFRVRANRFLRGMVRALVATMLQVGRGSLTIDEFRAIIDAKDCTRASFAAPAHGLFLVEVSY